MPVNINYFPEKNHFVVDIGNGFSNSTACLRLDEMYKQKHNTVNIKI